MFQRYNQEKRRKELKRKKKQEEKRKKRMEKKKNKDMDFIATDSEQQENSESG